MEFFKTVFVVDDNDTNLAMAELALEQDYRVVSMPSAAKMFVMLKKITPDLILLDIEMPEMDGFEALKILKATPAYANIPVIFVTNMSDSSNEAYGIELGAVDFIAKPVSKPVLLNRLKHHLYIGDIINERMTELLKLQNGIVFTMADLVESRDKNTGGHIDRIAQYARILVDAMIKIGLYSDELQAWDKEAFFSATRLHDLGKIAIPDAVLNKPDSLTDDEFKVMKTHPMESKKILDKTIERTDGTEFLLNAKLAAVYHHERWDGKGYPYGLEGTDIPLQGRIVAVVDVYDALVSERPYKKPLTDDEAMKAIEDGSGKQFDPNIVKVFIDLKEKVNAERHKLAQA
ncbi:MAG: response regulator [Coriobacteriales bacterium]|jgi:putative two-component system response regulator|nr:response regulator [Coriobacteriales bacterium]